MNLISKTILVTAITTIPLTALADTLPQLNTQIIVKNDSTQTVTLSGALSPYLTHKVLTNGSTDTGNATIKPGQTYTFNLTTSENLKTDKSLFGFVDYHVVEDPLDAHAKFPLQVLGGQGATGVMPNLSNAPTAQSTTNYTLAAKLESYNNGTYTEELVIEPNFSSK